MNGKSAAPLAPEKVVEPCTSEPDLNIARRKRRRTNEHEPTEVGASAVADEAAPTSITPKRSSSPRVIIPASSPLPTAGAVEVLRTSEGIVIPETSEGVLETVPPPRKVLKLNARGRFSSPPTKKTKDSDEAKPETPKRRGRKRKSAVVTPDAHRMVVCNYGQDEARRQDVGQRIERILNGTESVSTNKTKTTPKKRTPRKPKATHPFFVGKMEDPAPPKKGSPRKTSAITPGKLRVKASFDRTHESNEIPAFHSALLRDRFMIKHPGSKDAPFPDRSQAHVRGENDSRSVGRSKAVTGLPYRKRKQAKVPISQEASVLARFATELEPEADRRLRSDGFHEPDLSLHLPQKLLISGEEIAKKIKRQLSVALADSNEDELLARASQQAHHPSLQRLYDRIPTTLTAFDESKGEMLQWVQKYAPSCCADVLQPEKEMSVLRTWLTSLAVQAVGGAATTAERAAKPKAIEKPKKKRRKKADDLDDFLVDSDEDVYDMNELADLDDDVGTSRGAPKSIVQVAQTGAKLGNAVLLSGPHGCGKTAAAYAVAKELGYKVFEISSSERRSGRDVLDKIGDMTENHLVKHHGTESVEISDTEGPDRIDEAFQKDLESGRQGKMMSFFKPKTQPKSTPAEPKKIVKEKTVKAVQEAIKKRPKDQQQSLILLEEVDILFKDDKDFWTTILKLIVTSKRPFIMTCNDEDLVPLQAMSLHAILRFTHPPVDLATDYILLLAAAEGHLLESLAVESLYQHHHCDLRASISELDYWCQMGVGDPREGLSWIYQRWPTGSDVDAKGRTLRIVSEGTYRPGMGLSQGYSNNTESSLLSESAELDLAPSSALGWEQLPLTTMATPADPKSRYQQLAQFAKFADVLSAADFCCSAGLVESASLDPTQPDMPDKSRGHYIEGIALLQTDERMDYSDMSRKLLVATTLSAFDNFVPPIGGRHPAENELQQRIPLEMPLSRRAFSCFDAVSTSAEANAGVYPGLSQSAFDGPLNIITTDLAPYVRSIVQYDEALEEQRDRLDLLMTDGRKAKRARTTRAARSALEGGQRSTTRRERWFTKNLDFNAVLATGGIAWPRTSNAPPSAAGSVDMMSQNSADAPPSSMEEIKYED